MSPTRSSILSLVRSEIHRAHCIIAVITGGDDDVMTGKRLHRRQLGL